MATHEPHIFCKYYTVTLCLFSKQSNLNTTYQTKRCATAVPLLQLLWFCDPEAIVSHFCGRLFCLAELLKSLITSRQREISTKHTHMVTVYYILSRNCLIWIDRAERRRQNNGQWWTHSIFNCVCMFSSEWVWHRPTASAANLLNLHLLWYLQHNKHTLKNNYNAIIFTNVVKEYRLVFTNHQELSTYGYPTKKSLI